MSSRLLSNPFKRPETFRTPRRCIFLSVEGNNTEADYFTCLNMCLDEFADDLNEIPILRIQVLERAQDDGHSSPGGVVELMKECLSLRDTSEDGDLFAVVMDCDYAHPENKDKVQEKKNQLEEARQDCERERILFYLTNPCFEFWLLLHGRDIKEAYNEEEKVKLLENRHISQKHTYVSNEVSKWAGHNKRHISGIVFREKYWPNIPTAMERSCNFSSAFPEIYDNLGTNLSDLMIKIGLPLSPLRGDERGNAGQKRNITHNRL